MAVGKKTNEMPSVALESTTMETDESAHKEDDSSSDAQKRVRLNSEEARAKKSNKAGSRGWSVDSLRSPVPGDSRLPCIAKVRAEK